MKKISKKLALSAESIRSLSSSQLDGAAGASDTDGITCSINDPTTTGPMPSRAFCSLPAPCGGSGWRTCY